MDIIEKGSTLNLDIASKQDSVVGQRDYYFGAGWDTDGTAVDLDIVCACLTNGKLSKEADLVYFGNRTLPGVQLSKDNTTGEGEGDDESIVIKTSELPSEIDSLVIGLVAYAGADFKTATNPHFRACDGATTDCEQIADVKAMTGVEGDTVLTAFTLTRGDEGWTLKNETIYAQAGNGKEAIEAFAKPYVA